MNPSKTLLRFCLAYVGLCFCTVAWAGGNGGAVFNLAIFYQSEENTDESTVSTTGSATKTESKVTIYDLNFGYLFQNKIYLGLLTSNRTDSTGALSTTGSSYQAASVGYHFNDISYLHLHYIMNASVGANSFTGGKGYGADFGFQLPLSGNAHVGVQLAYRRIAYDMLTYVGSRQTTSVFTAAEVFPMLVIGFNFN